MDAVARLVAIEDIQQLKARYFRFVDTQDWDGMAQVFCRDATWDCTEAMRYVPLGAAPVGPVGPVTHGRDAIIDWIRGGFVDRTSVHHGHCHEVTIESETEARGIVAMEDMIRKGDRTTRLLHAAGHYYERYRFEDGAWRIAHVELIRLFNDVEPGGAYDFAAEPRDSARSADA